MDIPKLNPYLSAQLANNQLSHAYLFCGEDAFGQALALAQLLHCENVHDSLPCGQCPACIRMAAGTHSDCHIIEPDKNGHRIENMRHMQSMASLSSIESQWKIFILKEAEALNDPSANSLLKLLEEPPLDTIIILVSVNPDMLLPTIISRCQSFSFGVEPVDAPDEKSVSSVLAEAERFLMDLPNLPMVNLLLMARDRDKDKVAQLTFFCALLKLLHAAARGDIELPMGRGKALRSAMMMESSIEYLNKRINQRLLTDVVYLRLWQNSHSED